uniref:DEK proto-oncogene n=1 Tax=Periophthalmus magnuspinnatus TaxID=409849 RepID=A0A3B4B065_9GOBI
EGKRAKKSVERLDMQVPKKPVKLSIGDGTKLGDIPRTSHRLNKMKPVDLVPLHNLLFDRRGKLSLIKKNLRQFNGFPFDADSEQFTKKRDKLQKNFTNTKLKFVCEVLDLEKKGTHADLVHRIMMFLVSPKSSGKVSKKRSKKNLSGDDSKPKKNSKKRNGSKQKPSSNSSPKKSKAIVMDSSSDEEEEEEEEEGEGRKTETETDGSEAGSGAESGDKQEEEQSEDEEDEEEDEDEVRRRSG